MKVPEPVAALVVAVLALTLLSGISPTADGKLYFGTKTTVPLDNRGDAYFVNLSRSLGIEVEILNATTTLDEGDLEPGDWIFISNNVDSGNWDYTEFFGFPLGTSEEALVDNRWELTCAPGGYSNGDSITYDAAHPLIIAAGLAPPGPILLLNESRAFGDYQFATPPTGSEILFRPDIANSGSIVLIPSGATYCRTADVTPSLRTIWPVLYDAPLNVYTPELHLLYRAYIEYHMPRFVVTAPADGTNVLVGSQISFSFGLWDADGEPIPQQLAVTVDVGGPASSSFTYDVAGTTSVSLGIPARGDWTVTLSSPNFLNSTTFLLAFEMVAYPSVIPPAVWNGVEAPLGSIAVCYLDNGPTGDMLSLTVVNRTTPTADLLGSTLATTNLTSCAEFEGVSVDAVGRYVVSVSGPLGSINLPAFEAHFSVLASPVDENENGTFYVTGSTIGLPVTASSNCTAATAYSNASDIYRIEFSPIDFETLTGGKCPVMIEVNGLDFVQEVLLTVNDVPEPPRVVEKVFNVTALGSYLIPLELVDVNNVTSVSVAALPRYMEARSGSGAMLSPADPVDPWVINMTVGNSGFYLDNITLISTNGVDTSDATPVFVRVSVPCADPDTQGLSVLGLCQCLEAAYIDNGVCKLCEAGTYFEVVDEVSGCTVCPEQATCAGGKDPPRSREGWWRVPGEGWTYEACRPSEACAAGDVCREGHNGTRCEDCNASFYEEDGLCYECPSLAWLFLVLLLVIMIVVIILLVRVARKSTAYFTSLSVGFNFLQIIAILATFDLNWPQFVKDGLKLVSLLNFDINLFQPECAVAGGDVPFFAIWVLKLTAPLFFLLIFLVGHAFITCYYHWRKGKDERASPWLRTCRCRAISRPQLVVVRNASINAFITILMLLFLMLVSTMLEIFECDPDENYLIGDPTTTCGDGVWWSYVPFSVAAMLLYGVGIPFSFWAVLYFNRLNLFKELTIVKYGLMYRRYKPAYFLWELAILFRKLGIVVGVILIKSGSGRAVVAFLVILLSCAVHIRFKPYISSRVNRLETIHLVCACVVLAFGMLLASASEASNGVRTFVGVIVIMVVAVNAIAMVYVIWQEIFYQYRLVRRGVKGGFASDEVVVSDDFFAFDFRILEQSRNLSGTTSTLILSSGTLVDIRVELRDGHTGEKVDDKVGTVFIQTDGHFTVVTAKFAEVGRYTLNVDAFSVDEVLAASAAAERLENEADDGVVSSINPVFDSGRPASVASGRFSGQFAAAAGVGEDGSLDDSHRVSRRFVYSEATGASVMLDEAEFEGLKVGRGGGDEADGNDAGEGGVGQQCCATVKSWFELDGERFNHTVSFSINCDIRPPVQVTFPRLSTRFLARRGVVLAPRFFELSPHRSHKFQVRLGSASAVSVCRGLPTAEAPGTALYRRQDGVWVGEVTSTDGGPLSVWAMMDQDGDTIDSVRASVRGVGTNAFLPSVRCVDFVVLDTLGGWEDEDDVEDAMMHVLVNADGASIPMALLERIDDDIMQADMDDAFLETQGILYQPRRKFMARGEAVVFRLKLPAATAIVISPSKPTSMLDGVPLFREGQQWTTTWTPESDGDWFLWAQLPASAAGGGGDDAEAVDFGFSLSSKPGRTEFRRLVGYEVVPPGSHQLSAS